MISFKGDWDNDAPSGHPSLVRPGGLHGWVIGHGLARGCVVRVRKWVHCVFSIVKKVG